MSKKLKKPTIAEQGRAGINVVSLFKAPRHITKTRDLFLWLWGQLEYAEPTIAVKPFIVGELDALHRTFRNGRSITSPPMEWCSIFCEIDWANASSSTRRSSILLLQFLGQLSTYQHNNFRCQVTPSMAIEMMRDIWDHDQNYLRCDDEERGGRYGSTPDCERLHNVKIDVSFREDRIHDEWFLQSHFAGL